MRKVGPFSEDKQYSRAEAIQRLLDNNPQLDSRTRKMWQRHQQELCHNEETYNYRVKHIYSHLRRSLYE